MAPLPDDSVFKGKKLLTHSGQLVDAEEVLGDKTVVACYFSAHWCPPCRQFTPVLKDFFGELEGSNLAIIFVSSDRDEESMKSYFAEHGEYYAVPFTDSNLASALKESCGVTGIPKLAIVDKKGKMLHDNGRSDVAARQQPSKVLKKWEELSAAS